MTPRFAKGPRQAVSDAPFDELIRGLRAQGRGRDAEALESLKVVGWTSSSEMVGELGHAVLALGTDLPPGLEEVAERCMKEVRKLWPNIKPRKS